MSIKTGLYKAAPTGSGQLHAVVAKAIELRAERVCLILPRGIHSSVKDYVPDTWCMVSPRYVAINGVPNDIDLVILHSYTKFVSAPKMSKTLFKTSAPVWVRYGANPSKDVDAISVWNTLRLAGDSLPKWEFVHRYCTIRPGRGSYPVLFELPGVIARLDARVLPYGL